MKAAIFCLCLLLRCAFPALALDEAALREITFEQHPGAALPASLEFTDQSGNTVRLGDYFGKPLILVPAYFRCEMLCGGVMDGLLRALQGNRWTAGREFRVVYVSIDPGETGERAASQSRVWLRRYGRLGAEGVFLRGGEPAIDTLARAIGFHYRYDPASGEFAHPAGFAVITPEGRILRYFFGVTFSAGELEGALQAAAQNAPPGWVERLVLLCFHDSPIRSPYGGVVIGALRALALGTAAGLGLLIFRARRGREP